MYGTHQEKQSICSYSVYRECLERVRQHFSNWVHVWLLRSRHRRFWAAAFASRGTHLPLPRALSEMTLAPRLTAEVVSTTRGRESRMRPLSDSAEKPAKTTECTAPMRAHASCAARRSAGISMRRRLTSRL